MCAPLPPSPDPPPRSPWERGLWWAGWPVRTALLGVIRVYQLLLSPLLPPTCRYTPTCSAYALEAVRRYGAVRGALLATWRILRCNPWGGSGYDPPRWPGDSARPPSTNV
jgi:putative membrane protein insertion efficiency factor